MDSRWLGCYGIIALKKHCYVIEMIIKSSHCVNGKMIDELKSMKPVLLRGTLL